MRPEASAGPDLHWDVAVPGLLMVLVGVHPDVCWSSSEELAVPCWALDCGFVRYSCFVIEVASHYSVGFERDTSLAVGILASRATHEISLQSHVLRQAPPTLLGCLHCHCDFVALRWGWCCAPWACSYWPCHSKPIHLALHLLAIYPHCPVV